MILRKKSQGMMLLGLTLSLLLATPFATQAQPLDSNNPSSVFDSYDPYTLIAEVNALRAANGLTALTPDPILMSVSQTHADYMASIGTVTHYGADGSRPFQRSLAAGYPVAGDLSLGGFHAENIVAGRNMTPAQAVSSWTTDAPHLNTMLSPNFTDIGAGVAIAGDTVYYVIDASRKSGAAVPAYTPQVVNGTPVVNLNPLVSTIFPNTPAADGSIEHTVKSGETLWLIAITYGTKIDVILRNNNLPKDLPIYPGQKLVIRSPNKTVTPELPTKAVATPSITPTFVPISTSMGVTTLALPQVPDEAPAGTNAPGIYVPIVIVAGALGIAALLTIYGGRRKRL